MYKLAEKGMTMNDETWKKHANPLSVWTRVATLPFYVLAIWSRVWIGWYALIPLILLAIWTWYNPRAFPKPKTTKYWGSKGTFGERVFLNRKTIAIPAHHERAANILTAIAMIGAVILGYGLYVLDLWMTITGASLVYLGKMWFLDRMVWLYEDMKQNNPEYQGWEY